MKRFLWWVDVVTIALSLYTLTCGIAILLQYVVTHRFSPKHFQLFPVLG